MNARDVDDGGDVEAIAGVKVGVCNEEQGTSACLRGGGGVWGMG